MVETDGESSQQRQIGAIRKADGVTPAERYLSRLCARTFLSLWSYPGVYRNQGQPGSTGDGKEVCDLLVVFENHIIIFSDKDCTFPDTGDLNLDWSRWFRRAVLKSAEQVWGAERWIKTHPDRLFIDRSCQRPFPLALPDVTQTKFHRIVVAHDSSERCRQELGGSGSLMIFPRIVGSMHMSQGDDLQPFAIGQLDPSKGFIHVLDDTTLDILLRTLDTVSDFVNYLTKKERFITSGRLLAAAGEEDLLAHYLVHINDKGEHDFIVPSDATDIVVDQGIWDDFVRNPQRAAQVAADRISYAWDGLIETFNRHILGGTQYYASPPGFAHQDELMRYLAREPRVRRRILATRLLDVMRTTAPMMQRRTQVLLPQSPGDPCYVFLVTGRPKGIDYDRYREGRRNLLEACCLATKLRFPTALDTVGIATEPMASLDTLSSEDAIYIDARHWTPEAETEARRLQQRFDLLTDTKATPATLRLANRYKDVQDARE